MNTKSILTATAFSWLCCSIVIAEGLAARSFHSAYYKQLSPNTYLISLLPGARLIESLRSFQRRTKVPTASITGLGALKNIHIGQYRFAGEPLVHGGIATRPMLDDSFIEGHREIVSLTCNLTTHLLSGNAISESDPHCHIAVAGSDDGSANPEGGYNVVGGHLFEGEVAVVAELFVTTYPTPINKKSGGNLGGDILDLDEKNGGVPLN